MADFTNSYFVIIMVAEYLSCLILITMAIKLRKLYKERKSKVALLLSEAFFCLGLASVLQSLDEIFLNQYFRDLVDLRPGIGFSLAFLFSAISNYFILHFSYEIFSKEKSRLPKILGIADIVVCIIFGILRFPELIEESTIVLLIHVLLSWVIYWKIFILSIKTSARLEKKIDRMSFYFIGSYGLFLAMFYILYVYDFWSNGGSYTIIPTIAWGLGIVGGLIAYTGFIRPKWFVKMFSNGAESSE